MADNVLGIDPKLIQKAKEAVKKERDLLQAVLDAHNAWLSHRQTYGARALNAIQKDLESRFDDRNVWRDQILSVLSTAMWYGLDVRDYSRAMVEAEKGLTGSQGSLATADDILAELDRIGKLKSASEDQVLRSKLIRMAKEMPKGSEERRALLATLQKDE
jgi:hypothetical protein